MKVNKIFLTLVLVAVTLAFSLSISPQVHAKAKPFCAVAQVTLHGTASPAVHCLSTTLTYRPSTRGPRAEADPACQNPDNLSLYWNGPIGVHPNYLLCVTGTGLLNLNQQLQGSDYQYRNWNDQASAWWTGCYNVTFYSDINRSGASAYEPGSLNGANSPQGIFPLGLVQNDSLSSVWQDSPNPVTC